MKHGAYLLINVETGREFDVTSNLASKPYVRHVSLVTGLHDVICFIENEELDALKEHVYGIRQIPGITKTVTCFAFTTTE